ncbi:MAG: fasciclin domain-containing protein [Pseudomonadota bacterium]
MKRLLASTATLALIASPAMAQTMETDAEVNTAVEADLPAEYSTNDLNSIVLAQIDNETSTMTATDDRDRMFQTMDERETTASKDKAYETTIVDIAAGDDRFSTLVSLVKAADLAETLSAEGPYTVFAPTNDAFAALPAEKVEYLQSEDGREDLTAILKAHVIEGRLMADEITEAGLDVRSLSDQRIDITSEWDGTITIDGATVIKGDIEADNGVIHVIDTVIVPQPETTSDQS